MDWQSKIPSSFPQIFLCYIVHKLRFEEKIFQRYSVFQPKKKSMVCIKYKTVSEELGAIKWMPVMYF